MDPSRIVSQLDETALQILVLLDEMGGSASASELREMLGHPSTDRINHHRYQNLEPLDLIECESPEPPEPGKLPAFIWELTEKGELVAEEYDQGPDLAVDERLDTLEEQVAGLRGSVQEVKETVDRGGTVGKDEIADLTEDVNQLQRHMNTVVDDLSEMNRRLSRLEKDSLFGPEMRNQINGAIAMTKVSNQILKREYGESNVKAGFENQLNSITKLRPARFEGPNIERGGSITSEKIPGVDDDNSK